MGVDILDKLVRENTCMRSTTHQQAIAEEFNNYYVSVADNISNNKNAINTTVDDLNKLDPLNYLHSAFPQPFATIKLKHTTTGEIEEIIK